MTDEYHEVVKPKGSWDMKIRCSCGAEFTSGCEQHRHAAEELRFVVFERDEADAAAKAKAVLPDPSVSSIGRFPKGAHATSLEAAMDIEAVTGRDRVAILRMFGESLGKHPDDEAAAGWIDDEAEQHLGMLHTTYTARRGELHDGEKFGGWLMKSPHRRLTRSGRKAIVWILTEEAQRHMLKSGWVPPKP